MGYTLLQIFVTFWDAHNRGNKCTSYAYNLVLEAVVRFKNGQINVAFLFEKSVDSKITVSSKSQEMLTVTQW